MVKPHLIKITYVILIIILIFSLLLSSCAAPASPAVFALPASQPAKVTEAVSSSPYSFPLIVVGGEPEGIAAAVSAARNGVQTLLICQENALGGLLTQGRLNFLDMNYGPDKTLLTQGIFQEFYKSQGNAFDIVETEKYFLSLVQKEPNITLLLNTQFLSPLMDGEQIVGVRVNENSQIKEYYGQRIIDATADADVAAAAGVPFTVGAEDYGQKDRAMGVTLVFSLKGVNWPYVFLYNNWNRLISKIKPGWGDPAAGASWKVAWGYGAQALEYTPHDPGIRLRGPNLARQKNGQVLVNALLIFGVNGLDPQSKAQGIERGKAELSYIVKYMRENFAGFAHAELVDTAPQLYVRETRHIQGEYRLTIDDVLENRDQWDRIAHGSYPVDIQPAGPKDLGNVIGKPAIYSIPFRSLVPLKVNHLLVVGRSASYDSLAAGSARVIPVGMAVGEAGGVAVAYALQQNKDFRELSKSKEAISEIQAQLKKQGAYLTEYTPPRPAVMDHWAYPGLKVMRSLGLAAGGYNNDYRLDEKANYWDVNYLYNSVLARAKELNPRVESGRMDIKEADWRGDFLTILGQTVANKKLKPEEARTFLAEKEMLTENLRSRLKAGQGPTNYGELYMLMAGVYEYLLNTK